MTTPKTHYAPTFSGLASCGPVTPSTTPRRDAVTCERCRRTAAYQAAPASPPGPLAFVVQSIYDGRWANEPDGACSSMEEAKDVIDSLVETYGYERNSMRVTIVRLPTDSVGHLSITRKLRVSVVGALSHEAHEVGDHAMVAICSRALDGEARAVEEVARVLAAAANEVAS